MSHHRLAFVSFLVGFVFVGAACTSSKPAVNQTQPSPTTTSQRIMAPDESQASEEAPLSSGTDIDSLQKDLDNTDVTSIDSASTQMQTEINQ